MTGTQTVPGGIGDTALRPDAVGKAVGAFPYVADLQADDLLHAVLVRSTHPRAEILEIDSTEARAMPGVVAVLTAEDLPPTASYGPVRADRPVLADAVVRHLWEPVAVVVAEDRTTAVRAAATIDVRYRAWPPVLDVTEAASAEAWHPDGARIRDLLIHRGEVGAPDWADPTPIPGAAHVIDGEYRIGRRACTAAPPAVLAFPGGGGCGVVMNSAWWQADRDQIAECLNLTPDQLRVVPAASDGPPDGELSAAVLAVLLALRLRRPVKLLDAGVRSAPGAGPATRLRYRHHADGQGRILAVQAELLVDAGAYAQTAGPDLAALCASAVGPYRVPAAWISASALRTDNPPTPAERGLTAWTCLAVEAQMDALARRVGVDPVDLRGRNALSAFDSLPIGQVVPGGTPVAGLLAAVADAPLPGRRRAAGGDRFPGALGQATPSHALRRGVGHAVGLCPLLPGEGQDFPATATVRLVDGLAEISCAGAELGQGFLTVALQIVREVLGAERVELVAADSDAPSAGPAWGSRLSWVAGGAVHAAASGIAMRLARELGEPRGISEELITARGGRLRSYDGLIDASVAELAAGRSLVETATFCPPPTQSLDPVGAGAAFAGYGAAAHRAVVEVDVELGLVRLVELIAAAEAGRVINLTQLLGVLEGGATAGLGLALYGEQAVPTTRDLGGVGVVDLREIPQDGSWLGVKGVWDVPTGPAAAAVLAALRDATGLPLTEIPVRPWHLAGAAPEPA